MTTVQTKRINCVKDFPAIILFICLCSANIFPSPNSAIDSLKKILTLQQGVDKIITLSELSFQYHNNKPDSGIIYGEQALAMATNLKNKQQIANAMKNLSASYWMIGNNEKGQDLLLASLRLYEEMKDSAGMDICMQNLAVLYDYQKQYDKALEYYKNSIAIAEKIGTATALTYHNIGDLYNSLGQLDKALYYFKKALKTGKDPDSECFAIFSIGMIYENRNDFNKALEYYEKALKKSEEISSNVRTKAYIYLHYGDFQITLKNYPKAYNYLSRGLSLAKQIEEKKLLQDYYLVLSNYYTEIKNYKSANNYLLLHNEIQDSLFIEESRQHMMEMDAKYEAGKRESEIKLLKKDKQINDAHLKRANVIRNYLVAISILVLISSLIIYFIKSRSISGLKEKQAIINSQNLRLESANRALVESRKELEELNRNLEARVQEEITKREMQQLMLMQKSKLESLGIFSAGVAHEINQPLTSISFTIENMMYRKNTENLTDEYLETKFNLINDDILRITNIINHIKTFACEQSNLTFDRFNLNEVVYNSQLIVSAKMRNKNINLMTVLEVNPKSILGNKYRLEQVLINLIINARYAVENKEASCEDPDYKKVITIRTYSNDGFALLEVEDNGIGMTEEIKNKIFEPFFTTKDPQNGTGLGLSIVYGIIKDHKGEITVDSEENKFTRFTIKIPSINQEVNETT